MLNLYVRGRKRRVWSPGTIAASVGAHLLLLAGAVSAAGGDGHEHKDPKIVDVTYTEIAPKPKVTPPPAVEPQTPPPPKPDAPKVKLGDHRVIEDVRNVPPVIPPADPTEKFDATQYSGEGKQDGNVIVDNPPPSSEPTEAGNPEPVGNGEPMSLDMVEERPELSNRSLAERLLRQNYPDLLRDAGVTGRTIVTMVIDAEGRVEPGSVRVVESSHEAFSDPAVKVAERMRFRPAKLNRQAVQVLITLPIEWKIER
jgi:periplasmic protein TonB